MILSVFSSPVWLLFLKPDLNSFVLYVNFFWPLRMYKGSSQHGVADSALVLMVFTSCHEGSPGSGEIRVDG